MKEKYYGLEDIIDFGKRYPGKKLREVIAQDRKAVEWWLDNLKWFHLKDDARELMYPQGTFQHKPDGYRSIQHRYSGGGRRK